MFKYRCEICGKEFEHKHDSYAIRAIVQHVGKEHGLSKEEYTIQYVRGGNVPLCACGCGHPVEIAKGWDKWHKYYKDHKNTTSPSQESIDKTLKTKQEKLKDPSYDSIPPNILEEALTRYRKHELTLKEIEASYGYDHRTFQRLWKLRGYSTREELLTLATVSKGTSGTRRGESLRKLNKDFYDDIRDFILNNSGKYTINDINIHFGNKVQNETLSRNLRDLYGDSLFEHVVFGIKSLEELKYLEILRFFLGPINVKLGYKIKDRIYDSLIVSKILFEYDGSYYHSGKDRRATDRLKDKLAKESGYYIIRVSDKQSKQLRTLIKIIVCANLVLLRSKVLNILKKIKKSLFGIFQ